MVAKASEVLFELPIRGDQDGGKGRIVATQPKPKVYLLSFENGPDNRLLSVRVSSRFLTLLLSTLSITLHHAIYPSDR